MIKVIMTVERRNDDGVYATIETEGLTNPDAMDTGEAMFAAIGKLALEAALATTNPDEKFEADTVEELDALTSLVRDIQNAGKRP